MKGSVKKIFKHLLFKFLLNFFFFLGKVLKKRHINTASAIIGKILYIVPNRRNKIALSNLKIAFAEQIRDRERNLLKKFLKSIALAALEISYITQKKDKVSDWIEIVGIEHLHSALGKGRGVIALSGHIGNVPIMLAGLAEKGYPVAVLYKEGKYLPKGFLFNLIKSYQIDPIPFISDRDVPREIIKLLNGGKIVFILSDQARRGTYARFFNKLVRCQLGAFVIARRKSSPLLPVFTVREGGRHKILIYPELEAENIENPILLVEKYNTLLENLIREYPEQYYWFHRRFKKMKDY